MQEPQEINLFHSLVLQDDEFNAVRDLVYKHFGISLSDRKRPLVQGRLQKLVRTLGFGTFGRYLDFVASDKTGKALAELVNRVSTNHTYFYRESDHFQFFLSTALPEIASTIHVASTRNLRIWCAGCSTGEEAYMLVMLMKEHFGTSYKLWDAGLLATDISDKALKTARAGIYPEERLKELPQSYRHTYFTPGIGGTWTVNPTLRNEVTFRLFNLNNLDFPFKKPFHVIFCRNVMIYFDRQTTDALVKQFHKFLVPGGYLFVGHSESLRQSAFFKYLRPAVYQKARVR